MRTEVDCDYVRMNIKTGGAAVNLREPEGARIFLFANEAVDLGHLG